MRAALLVGSAESDRRCAPSDCSVTSALAERLSPALQERRTAAHGSRTGLVAANATHAGVVLPQRRAECAIMKTEGSMSCACSSVWSRSQRWSVRLQVGEASSLGLASRARISISW